MKPRADIMGNVGVVKADSSHIKKIAEIERECIPDGWSEKAFRDALCSENSLIFAAVCDGETIGFLNGSFVLDEAELLNIAVSAEYRRNGAASELLGRFERELLSLEVKTVFLEVREKNTFAIRFYAKYGYTQNGLRKNYYCSPTDNAVLMAKLLR